MLLVNLYEGIGGGPYRPRTWVRLTTSGRAALDAEIALLKEIVGKLG